MLTMTISFKHTDHEIVLGFETPTSAKAACQKVPMAGSVCISDDFSQNVDFKGEDVLCVTLMDPTEHWKLRNYLSLVKLRAENDFNMAIQKDPTLSMLVGGAGPRFGKS